MKITPQNLFIAHWYKTAPEDAAFRILDYIRDKKARPFYARKIVREEADRGEDCGGKVPQSVTEIPQKDFPDKMRHTGHSLYI